jgi:hypothetical protein
MEPAGSREWLAVAVPIAYGIRRGKPRRLTLTAFSSAIAVEYGRLGVRVNTILPGFIDREMIIGDGEFIQFV